MKRNGYTRAGTQRWRCTSDTCNATGTKQHPDKRLDADLRRFITHITKRQSMTEIAEEMSIFRQYLNNRFRTFWYIPTPDPVDPHRVYGQIFIDGTRLSAGCLLIASTKTHIVNWVWARSESTDAYIRLLQPIPAPLMVCLDGGRGAKTAIEKTWPTTAIQRCPVHAQRVVRRHVTSKPRTEAGEEIYKLALNLTRIKDVEEARNWSVELYNFNNKYRSYMDEKTRSIYTGKEEFSHVRVRRAYYSLEYLDKQEWLFTYLNPPKTPATTTSNGHRQQTASKAGLTPHSNNTPDSSGEGQRKTIDWWLYLRTNNPQEPLTIAREHNWGRDALSKVNATTRNENKANHETGRPAL